MRKALVISLSILYVGLSTGLPLNIHYCGGKLDSVSLSFATADCCCDGGEMRSSCCDDEQVALMFTGEQVPARHHEVIQPPLADEIPDLPSIIEVESTDREGPKGYGSDPPPLIKPPLHLLNCSFTFYG